MIVAKVFAAASENLSGGPMRQGMENPRRQSSRLPHWVRLVSGLMLLAVVAYSIWKQQQSQPAAEVRVGDESKSRLPGATPSGPSSSTPSDSSPSGSDSSGNDSSGNATSDQSARSGSARRTYDEPANAAQTIVPSQTIYDLDREVAYRGDVDLTATLARIKAGKLLRFSNDGSTFQNREGRLPKKPAGYYKEYVHPTPGLSGPGPQRIVMGQGGEAYYTPDHYETFQRVDKR